MDKHRFLIETHLRTGQSIKELAAAHGVSESWLFKLLRRYRLEGPESIEPRSRRPKTSPSRIADLYEDEIVRTRKELAEGGFDAGAETIHFHMSTPGRQVPSVSTIYRVLVARGRRALRARPGRMPEERRSGRGSLRAADRGPPSGRREPRSLR